MDEGWSGRATNGREAVEKAIKLKADVAVVDTSMPELEGQAKSVNILLCDYTPK
jgi:chemotaxis response regulator CheB